MPILIGGLTWQRDATFQLQTAKVQLDIFRGFNELPETRGEDDVIPGLPGRFRRNRVDDVLEIELRGSVRGLGATVDARAQDFRASVTALQAAFDPVGGPGTLSVIAPYLGLPSGSQSIEAYPVAPGIMGGESHNLMSFMRFSIELIAIGDPPRWGVGGEGSGS